MLSLIVMQIFDLGLWTQWSNCLNECGDEVGTRHRSRFCYDHQKCGTENLTESEPCPAQCNTNTCESAGIFVEFHFFWPQGNITQELNILKFHYSWRMGPVEPMYQNLWSWKNESST